eukprot:2676338-Rhodomonas_salina.1
MSSCIPSMESWYARKLLFTQISVTRSTGVYPWVSPTQCFSGANARMLVPGTTTAGYPGTRVSTLLLVVVV